MKTIIYTDAPQSIQRIIDQCPAKLSQFDVDEFTVLIDHDDQNVFPTAGIYSASSELIALIVLNHYRFAGTAIQSAIDGCVSGAAIHEHGGIWVRESQTAAGQYDIWFNEPSEYDIPECEVAR